MTVLGSAAAIIDSWETASYTQVVKYCVSRFAFTDIFRIASIVFLTIGSGYLSRFLALDM